MWEKGIWTGNVKLDLILCVQNTKQILISRDGILVLDTSTSTSTWIHWTDANWKTAPAGQHNTGSWITVQLVLSWCIILRDSRIALARLESSNS